MSESSCPCGSEQTYEACCEPYISGVELPQRAEQLMRSRYCAYVMRNATYLRNSWHESTRPEDMAFSEETKWFGLKIVDTAGGEEASEAWVEFEARFKQGGRVHVLKERSRFIKEEGRWLYIDGVVDGAVTKGSEKIGRNEPCPCGSGKKFKRCCGR